MSEQPPQRPDLPPFRRPAPPPPAPPPSGLLRPEETPLMEYLRKRTESMEVELALERERACAAEGLIKQQEALRGEVETQLKAIAEQMRQQKALQMSEEDRQASHGRISALEQRLDEMHKTWASLLKDAIGRREFGLAEASDGIEKLVQAVAELKGEVSALKESAAAAAKLPPEVREMRELLPALEKSRAEEEGLLRARLCELVGGLGDVIVSRLKELGSRLGEESSRQNERLEQLSRERAALARAIEEQRHEARQEALREQAGLQQQLDEQMKGVRSALGDLSGRQGAASQALEDVRKLSEAVHAILQRPEKAKDQMLQEIEAEKRDLMKALRERNEAMRAHAVERREIERTLGESLMELRRELEGERTAHLGTQAKILGLERAIDALKAEAELRRMDLGAKDERFAQLAGERDALVKALAEEAERVRRLIEERALSDRAWEEKIVEYQKLANDAREKACRADQAGADLRAQVQTLSDHLSRLLREKEAVESRHGQWQKEREDLAQQLQKKDEMIAMLSATFRNLLKKPAE